MRWTLMGVNGKIVNDGERLFMVNSNPDDNLEDADNDDDDDDVLIELFSPIPMVFASSKNSKYFSSNCENDHFRAQK